MGDCTVGKELKQSTCRYVKKCKPGWVRNDKYICRKTLRRTGKRANKSPVILTGNVAKNVLNSPNEKRFGALRGMFGSPQEKKRDSIFGTPSPNEAPKLTNKELEKLFESPNDELPKIPKNKKKLITGKVRQWKSRKNFRSLNNLQNSPNEPFDLKKHKHLAYARLQKTKDTKRLEFLEQREKKGTKRHLRKITKKYNLEA